jgi:hypothetical protein
VVLLARVWQSKPLDTVAYEDDYIWLSDALTHGFVHDLGTPYNGYPQTMSRLVTEPVAQLPVRWFAPAMALFGALIVTGCAFIVWCASAGHIRNPAIRGVLASLVVLVPVVGAESFDNVTNSIWFLLFTGFWVLLWRPRSWWAALFGGAFLLVATLSNGGFAFFLPVWLLRFLAMPNRRDAVMVGKFGLGFVTRFAISWAQTNLLNETGQIRFPPSRIWSWALIPSYIERVVGSAVCERITGPLWAHFGVPVEVVLGAALASSCR